MNKVWKESYLFLRVGRRYYCSSKGKEVIPLVRRKCRSDRQQSAPFVDKRTVTVTGGNGGDGCISFASLFANEFAGPDGGDGGHGGHIIFQSNPTISSLSHVSPLIKAEDGGKGQNSNRTGANAPHRTIQVPLGTTFTSLPDKALLSSLSKPNELFVAARGGSGGKGNRFFATPVNQSPEICEYGAEGETSQILVQLSLIADFGLIGFPNAGKSTLLRAISRARPKVASYTFTTMQPHVGVVHFDDDSRVTVADLPGLIEDAHLNRGLGIQFLRHIERCIGLIFVLDTGGYDPVEEWKILKKELEEYNKELLSKPRLILANKMDTPEAKENFDYVKEYFKGEIIPVSSKYSEGLKEFLVKLKGVKDTFSKDEEEEVIYSPVSQSNETVNKWR